jgi:cytochrome c-type biogenesis protein CcmF
VALLLYAFFSHDFHLSYVADYSSRDMSPLYLLTSFYAGNEGSLLLWAWLLSIFSTLTLVQNRTKNTEYMAYVTSIIMAIEAFFLVLLVFIANPFAESSIIPLDGRGLNPELESIGMLLHPPVIISGYVALTVPFAFAVTSLIVKKVNNQWLSTVRSWVLVSWLFLGVGNIIGAWWAYTELGWGGYWAWDPVENAGLMPWLMATAVIHACVMQRARGAFKAWNIALIIIAFNLTIFGTFIARSDLLTSVHNFGLSEMDPFFLSFLGVALIGPFALLVLRRRFLKGEPSNESVFSRENAFLLANLLLVFATLVIFLGTVLHWKPSFFNYWAGSTLFALLIIMGLCALIGWRRVRVRKLGLRVIPSLLLAVITCLILSLATGQEWYTVVLFSLCALIVSAILAEWYRGVSAHRHSRSENPFKSLIVPIVTNRPHFGGLIVHLGIIIIGIAVIASSFYTVEAEAALQPGESMSIDNYSLTYEEMSTSSTGSRIIISATLLAYNGDKLIGEFTPKKQYHRSYSQPVSEVAIRYSPVEDLYIIFAMWDHDETAAFKVLINPLVTWIWIGGGVLFLGSLIALWPHKRRPEFQIADRTQREGTDESDS